MYWSVVSRGCQDYTLILYYTLSDKGVSALTTDLLGSGCTEICYAVNW